MKLRLTNPTSAFDMIEVISFNYTGIPRQNNKKQLFIKAIKFKLSDDGIRSYSDEPPFEVFIKDLDEYLINDVTNGNTQRQQTFESTVESVGSILKDKFGIEYELI
ncbi:MAG: hypothetical protein MK076_05460 [Flavobacteriales bacterium]|nr:hypothetical protein [Flavobacteriales bacterium]